jgi:transposase-like protein
VFADGPPAVVITDADKALMAAIAEVFPTTINQLCRWHIEQNILKNCRKHFQSIEAFDEFMKCIKQIGSNCGDQEKELEQLKKLFPTEAVKYFLNQWWVNGQRERWQNDIYASI